MKKTFTFMTLALASASFATPKIISDIYPIQQIANAIAGETTDVLVDSPISPHNYKIKPSDIKRIESADLVVRVSEQFVPNVSRYVEDDDKRLLDLLHVDGLIKLKGHHHHHDGHEHGEHDEHEHEHEHEHSKDEHKHDAHDDMEVDKHIWLSPDNAKVIAGAIAERLVSLDPENQQAYADNLKDFSTKIDAQKSTLMTKLSPVKAKPFVVFHNAYQYFEKTFNIEQTAMVREDVNKGIRTKSFVMLEKALKDYSHVCVFKEPQFEATVVEQLALNKNVSVASLDPIGYNKNNTGYFKILDDLADSMVTCLGKDK